MSWTEGFASSVQKFWSLYFDTGQVIIGTKKTACTHFEMHLQNLVELYERVQILPWWFYYIQGC